MRVPLLVAGFVLLAAMDGAAADALTGTWSPDRQIAVASEPGGDGKWRCYFRDQRTGANFGEVATHDPRPAGGEVLMRAAWNFPGTRVVLLIHYAQDAEEMQFFCKGGDGRLQPVALTTPDPIRLYEQRHGRPQPKTPVDFAEAGVGPWTDDNTVELFLGKARPDAKRKRYVHYYAEFKVRFRGQRAAVTHLYLKGPRVLDRGPNYSGTLWGAFMPAQTNAPAATETKQAEPDDEMIISHDCIAEESVDGVTLQEGCDEYRADFGHFPPGDNREIMRQLVGLNSKQKAYVLITTFIYDSHGHVVDLWDEPFVFDLSGEHARVFSRKCELAIAEQADGRQWPAVYDPTYYGGKEENARRICYQLALGIRLAVQRDKRVPTSKNLRHVLFDRSPDGSYPILGLGDKVPCRVLNDPWGQPYRIALAADGVAVSSTHLPGEVWTETFVPVP